MSRLIAEIQSLLDAGGFVMGPLLIMCLVLWHQMGGRAFRLRRGHFGGLRPLLTEAPKRGHSTPVIAARSARRLAAHFGTRQRAGAAQSELGALIDEVFAPLRAELAKGRALVKALVIVAPLAGLLGTVSGMIETFSGLGDGALFAQSGGVAGGISQALLTTQMGLVVAVPGVVVGRFLDRMQKTRESELDELRALTLAHCGTEAA